MNLRFLLICLASVFLAGCSTAGAPGQTTVIVVTATTSPLIAATNPPQQNQNPTTVQPTFTPAPLTNPAPTVASTSTLSAIPATPTTSAVLPATGPAAQISVKQLLDYVVVDTGGIPLGEVSNLIILRGPANSARGEIPFLVVKSSQRDDWLIPVPWNKVQFRSDLMAIALPVNATQFINAPGFNDDFWPGSIAAQQTAVQNFWSNPNTTAPAAPLSQPGLTLQARDYITSDDLFSADFISPQGVKLGEIEDLAIDWKNSQPDKAQSGQFGYIVLQLDDDLVAGDLSVPVPWRLVPATAGQENLVVNLAPNVLQTAPSFPGGILPNLYEEPVNTQLNTFWTGK